ncbi:MAG: thioredoxin family protein [Luteolibacter sp.]|uniref:thioredoxin family protein n=1 Tax=Luteolibacter sp. TaxID=1962973 RepID=UPI003263972F
MKFPGLLLVVGLFFSSGCERVRKLAGEISKPGAAGDAVPVVSGPKIVNLTEDDLGSFCRQRGKLTIVEYYANWNGQSLQLVPVFQTLTEEFGGRVLVGKINIETSPKFTVAQEVKSTPDLRFYSDGMLVDRIVGLPEVDEIRQRIAAQVKKLPAVTSVVAAPPVEKQLAAPMKKNWLPPGMKRR